jgi:hypothetical protein
LAFHPYPQVIRPLFNVGRFGPPRGLTRASPCPWVDHSASGLEHATIGALFGLAFATASPHGLTSPHTANSQAHSSKGTPSHPKMLRRLVGARFQVLFHSPPGVLFTIPSRYLSAIGHQVVFRLGRWSCQIHTGFLGPRATWEPCTGVATLRLRGSHPLCRPIQGLRLQQRFLTPGQLGRTDKHGPTTPRMQLLPDITHTRFGLFRFRSPLLSESLLFSLPAGTEMFHFPAFPPITLCIQVTVTAHDCRRVSPFGNPRIIAWLPTPRGLSQAPTSFIGSWCQGIHHCALNNLTTKMKMLASTVQFSRYGRASAHRRRVSRRRCTPEEAAGRYLGLSGPTRRNGASSSDPSGPNSVPKSSMFHP